MSPQALREGVLAAGNGIAGDAETDQEEDNILPAPAAPAPAGPSGDQRDQRDQSESPDSPPARRGHKRKRVRHLFSSSDEDDEDLKNIKRRGKKRREDCRKKRKIDGAKCRVRTLALHPPPLSVAARVDQEDKVVGWLSVSTEQYKQVCR